MHMLRPTKAQPTPRQNITTTATAMDLGYLQRFGRVVPKNLESGMFKDDTDKTAKAKMVVDELGSHAMT